MNPKTNEIIQYLAQRNSKKETLDFAKAIIETDSVDAFMECYFTAQSPIPERASWVMTMISDIDSNVFEPYLDKLIDQIQTPHHQSIERGVMRTLSQSKIPENKSGILIDTCFQWIIDPQKLVAAKVFALETAYNLSKDYPELANELEQVILTEWDKYSIAFQVRGRKILRLIRKAKN